MSAPSICIIGIQGQNTTPPTPGFSVRAHIAPKQLIIRRKSMIVSESLRWPRRPIFRGLPGLGGTQPQSNLPGWLHQPTAALLHGLQRQHCLLVATSE
jgi:hypothetical protein